MAHNWSDSDAGSGGSSGGNQSKGGTQKSAAAKRKPQRKDLSAAIKEIKAQGDADFEAGLIPF